jgi:hypothetical protein
MGKMVFFLLLTEQRRESTGRPAGGGGRGADDPAHGDGREVGQNREEVEGNSFRLSPWSGMDCGGRSTAAGVCSRGGLEWRRWELGEERGRCLGGAGRGEVRRESVL